MVAIIVMAASLIVSAIIAKSESETLPVSIITIAPIVAGIASLMPFGLHKINTNVTKKVIIVIKTIGCILFYLPSNNFDIDDYHDYSSQD